MARFKLLHDLYRFPWFCYLDLKFMVSWAIRSRR